MFSVALAVIAINAWGRHYTIHIQAVAFDLLIAFSLLFPRTHGFRSTTIPAVINNNNNNQTVLPVYGPLVSYVPDGD
jgi:hypothetical protein